MNKRILSGTGKEANYTGSWAFYIFMTGATVVGGFILANTLGYTQNWAGRWVRNDAYYIFLYGSLIFAFFEFCLYAYVIDRMKQTELRVYEHHVEGKGFGSSFLTFAEIASFKLDYDKIASVDVTKQKLTINAYGKDYLIILHNPHLYAEAINNHIKKSAQSQNVTTIMTSKEKKVLFCTDCGQGFDDSTKAFCPGCGAKR